MRVIVVLSLALLGCEQVLGLDAYTLQDDQVADAARGEPAPDVAVDELADAALDELVDELADVTADTTVSDVAGDQVSEPTTLIEPEASADGAPSCEISCGADGGDNCCTSLSVRGGTYYRTYSNNGSGPTGEADPATVSSFRLDKYLVTVGRFREFVAALYPDSGMSVQPWLPVEGSGKHTHLNLGEGLVNGGATSPTGNIVYETGWDATDWSTSITPTDSNLHCAGAWSAWTSGDDELPINCVNWYEAYAFCIWDGGFLPSDAELEYASATTQEREYPWGSAAPGIQYAIYDCDYPSGSSACSSELDAAGAVNLAPVGQAPLGAGAWGQLDLAGELWAWTVDWAVSYFNPCVDCAMLVPGSGRAVRGGSFDSPDVVTASSRAARLPEFRQVDVGIRCARTP